MEFGFPSIRFEFSGEKEVYYTISQSIIFHQQLINFYSTQTCLASVSQPGTAKADRTCSNQR